MRREAALLATICLHFPFWNQNGTILWLPLPLPASAIAVALITTAFTAIFFAGPALAIHRNGNGLFATVEAAIGPFPTRLVRLCALWYLVHWVAGLLLIPSNWALPDILKRPASNIESLAIAFVLLSFLTATANELKLALFSNRLSIAVLIACAIRVHNTPAYLTGPIESVEWGLNNLALAVAPMAFLAANLATTFQTRGQIISTAALGLALPLWVSVFLVGLINMATLYSRYYQPSGGPRLTMAVLSGVSSLAIPSLMLILTVTLFGPIRLGIHLLRTTLPPAAAWIGLLAIFATTSRVTLAPVFFLWDLLPDIPATILATTAAVVTAGLILPPKTPTVPIFALLAGTIAGLHNINNPEILPAYATAFTITLAGRKLQKP